MSLRPTRHRRRRRSDARHTASPGCTRPAASCGLSLLNGAAAHPHARRLSLLGQDRGAPAHLVGGAHRRRAARVPRHRRRAVPRLPHRLLPGAAAAGLMRLRRAAAVRARSRRPGRLRARVLARRCSCCRASASIARAATGCRARAGAASAAACRDAPAPFAWTYLWTTLLMPLTLGWILPWRAVRLQQRAVRRTRFGDKAFTFTGRAGPLYKRFWLVWVAAIVLFIGASAPSSPSSASTCSAACPDPAPAHARRSRPCVGIVFLALLIFAMIRAWYSTRMLNYFASQTNSRAPPSRSAATVPSLVWLDRQQLSHPHAVARLPLAGRRGARDALHRRPACPRRRRSTGSEVGQNPDALLKSGEGLAEAFNVDAF